MRSARAATTQKGAGTPNDRLVGGQGTLPARRRRSRPSAAIGPMRPRLFDYIRRAMPLVQSKSLTNEEVYGVVAYLLNLNGIVPDDAIMNAQTLPKVVMPNRDGFITFARGK